MAQNLRHIDKAAPRAERRQLTVMFCDLVGSTALSEQFDPEDMRDLLTSYRQACASAIHQYGGFVARYIGDGILVYFGYPRAHEYEAEHSVRAGLEIVKNLAELSGPPLSARIGIATGTVVVGDIVGEGTEEHHAVVGQTPNLAARLIEMAGPGEIIISDSTQQLLVDLFEFRDLGPAELKGFAEPMGAWQIIGESAVKSHSHAIHNRTHLTPLIARDDEVERLQRCWAEAKTGKGQVVLISGEAGIGKSRLARHFVGEIAAENQDLSITKMYCSNNYQNSTLYPIINQITQASEIDKDEPNALKIERLENHLNKHSKKSNDEIALIMELLSINFDKNYQPLDLSPDAIKLQTFQILEQLTCESAQDKPALLIVEDLHWSDPTTRELLDRLVLNRVHELPLLIILTFRTEFVPSWPDEHYITDIKVKRLSPADSEKLLTEMMSNTPLPHEVIKKIIERSDRVPLFLEEVYKATRENISLNRGGDQFDARRSSSETDVPSSLAGSLMERLDRLGSVKGVAQVAAAVGHVFSSEILQHILPLAPAELSRALDQLILSEIIHLREVGSDMAYVFKHALLQDAAYSSLLRGERRKLHTRIAQIIEEKYPETANREPERLADHCSKGGLAERAIDYWQRAGERARERSANSEAIGHLSAGLELLKSLPGDKANAEREINLRTSLALALTALHGGGAAEVKENYSRARQLSQLDSDSSEHFTIMIGSWLNSFIGAELYDAQSLSNELLELAARKDNAAYLVEAKRVRGMTLFYMGDFAGAQSTIQSAIELHDPEHHRLHALRYGLDPLVCCEAYLAYSLLFLGQSEQAICKSDEAVGAAQGLDHPYSHAFALAFAAFVRQNLEQQEATQVMATKAIEVSNENEFQFWAKQQLFVRSWAAMLSGGGLAGTVEMRKAMDSYLESGSTIGSTRILSMMAEVYIKNRQSDEGRAMLERALLSAHKTGEKFYLAEIHRLEAELCLLRSGKPDVAEICCCFRRSMDVAESQNAVYWQLRTAKSIASLGRMLFPKEVLPDRILKSCESVDVKEAIAASRNLLDKLSQSPENGHLHVIVAG